MRQKPVFPRNRNRRSAGFCIEIVSEDFLNPVPIRLTFVFLVGMILIAFLRAQISKSSPSKFICRGEKFDICMGRDAHKPQTEAAKQRRSAAPVCGLSAK